VIATPLMLLAAATCGQILSRRIHIPFALPWRLAQAAVAVTIVLPGAWGLTVDATLAGWLGALLLIEVALVTTYKRRDPTLSQLARPNTGFWSLPIVAVAAPAALPAAVLYETISHLQLGWHLKAWRAQAPRTTLTAGSRILDYLPVAVAGVGLLLNMNGFAVPSRLQALPAVAALPLGVVGFFLLGTALPAYLPDRGRLRTLLPSTWAVRFGPAAAVLIAAAGGVAVPAWVAVAVSSPAAFITLAWARMFHGDTDAAWTRLLITLIGAAALTPLLLWVAR
jgi:predicted permease